MNLLKTKTATFTPANIITSFIVYELDTWSRDLNSDFTLKDGLFGGVKLAKTADPDKQVYTRYGIGFNSHSEFSLTDRNVGKNVSIFGVNVSSSVHIDDKKKYILILVKTPTQGLDNTTLTEEAQYSINFSRSNRKLCLRLHGNRSNSFLFVNAMKIYQVQSKRF